MHLGIDFGTTFSSAALFVNGEIKRVKEPIRSGYSYPSSAFVDNEGKVLVGQAAENLRGQDISRYWREFKRDLGRTTPSTFGNRRFLPEDLVSEMLKVLKREAEEMVNQQIESATVTIPASYAGYRAELMEQAARDAGFKQVQLLAEPVASAIYYDQGQPLADGERLLVYDLGGGTFDAALMQKRGDRFELLAQPVGDEKLGGRDFDTAIYQHLRQNCSETLNQLLDPRQRDARAMRIRYRVEDWLRDFKHQLSVVETHTDDLPTGDFDAYTLSRDTFQGLIHQQLQTTVDLCNRLVHDAGLKWSQVERILLVGGSCRIPYVRHLLEKRFNCNVVRVDEPELAVCLGAAIEQWKKEEEEQAINTYISQGDIYYGQWEYQLALQNYESALSLNPNNTAAHQGKDLVYRFLKEQQEKEQEKEQEKQKILRFIKEFPEPLLPVTIVTGFLGSGKSTFINEVLENIYREDTKIAVILNEFGETSINNDLIIDGSDILSPPYCSWCKGPCSINNTEELLVDSVYKILERSEKISYLVLETSGMADPLPIALTFLGTELRDMTRLESIITVIDAENFSTYTYLFDSEATQNQITYGDIIILNKVDLFNEADVNLLEVQIRDMKESAIIIRNSYGKVPLALILGLNLFEAEEHFHFDGESENNLVFFESDKPFAVEKFQLFLDNQVTDNIFRAKGIIWFEESNTSHIFHLSGKRFTIDDAKWKDRPQTQLLIIGQDLDREKLIKQLENCRRSGD